MMRVGSDGGSLAQGVKTMKRTMLFTTTNIRSLVDPPEWIWDEEQPHLALRRGRTWYCRVPGKRGQKPYPIGTTAELEPSAARIRVRRDREAKLDGGDARAERADQAAQAMHR